MLISHSITYLGQAVLEQNAADDGLRRFIAVQYPEQIENSTYPTIAHVGKARLTAVIRQLASTQNTSSDLGFRSFKLAPSHFRDWAGLAAPTPDEYLAQMRGFGDPLFDGFDAHEVIWEVALKEGYPLTSRVENLSIQNYLVHRITDLDTGRFFHMCLDGEVSSGVVNALKLDQDDLFVCRDLAIDDTVAANLALHCRLKTI